MRRLLLIAGAASALLLAPACGEAADDEDSVASVDGSGTEQTGEAAEELSQEEAMANYAECMRDRGVEDFPDPGSSGAEIDPDIAQDPDFEAAHGECEEELPEQSTRISPEQEDTMIEYAECMRDNGVEDFPDLTGGDVQFDPQIARDPEFEAAMEACQEILEEMQG